MASRVRCLKVRGYSGYKGKVIVVGKMFVGKRKKFGVSGVVNQKGEK